MPYLKLIRCGNLLFIALCLLLIRFGFFQQFDASTALSNLEFILLTIAVVSIAASGYVINNILDYEADRINAPKRLVIHEKISEKTAYNLFFALNIIGVGLGFYIANVIEKPSFSAIFIFTSALLYFYATYLKHIAIAGNLVVSLLVGLVVLLPVVFDLYPKINAENIENQRFIFNILIYYALYAMLINFVREIVKDQQDIDGDYKVQSNTLPLLIGQKRTNAAVFIFCFVLIASSIIFLSEDLYNYTKAVVYALVFIIAPILAMLAGILKAKTKKDYAKFSLILKCMLFFGLLSLGFQEYLIS
ncbi:geranylgeranylglycerol-phosphate geranylgeranyltransferase [Zunongwangia endophytica]|uniref:Geranylgeranylglycerol-phosphate geranylgeranyltransferase n=1 Tax=Zunongwangia endophytica TaxID=1808945 RepID=A0ABV8H4X2_9FLAO|nr:geranylgeranylglycerol-phosphate geranylgeranyltransferase [Zunongwangia endophytica]MDN3594541.1 geranylgeranylglycerol-phosphate geranylgeranyltransferase [Zunongwangia endophytica]